MEKIRMVVTDLDGTLLRTNKQISAYTTNVVCRLRANGILFVIATARPVRTVKALLPQLPWDGGVYHNGAVVYDGTTRVGGIGIADPVKLCERILREQPACRISVEAEDTLYANFDVGQTWPGNAYVKTSDFHEIRWKIADKIILEASSIAEMEKYQKYLPNHLYLQLSENQIAMIMNKQAVKTNGIRLLAQRHGITMDQIVAFGDDYNDIEMLKACGTGIAMSNALQVVKDAADAICGNNDNDGVAKWLAANLE